MLRVIGLRQKQIMPSVRKKVWIRVRGFFLRGIQLRHGSSGVAIVSHSKKGAAGIRVGSKQNDSIRVPCSRIVVIALKTPHHFCRPAGGGDFLQPAVRYEPKVLAIRRPEYLRANTLSTGERFGRRVEWTHPDQPLAVSSQRNVCQLAAIRRKLSRAVGQ